ncbi:dihydrofolate reductase family protein, partial [Mycobacterium palustre]
TRHTPPGGSPHIKPTRLLPTSWPSTPSDAVVADGRRRRRHRAGALALLRAHGMNRVLCEGGPTLLGELVDAGAISEICVTLAPKLAKSQPVGHREPSRLSVPVAMRLEHALTCDDYLFLKYRR